MATRVYFALGTRSSAAARPPPPPPRPERRPRAARGGGSSWARGHAGVRLTGAGQGWASVGRPYTLFPSILLPHVFPTCRLLPTPNLPTSSRSQGPRPLATATATPGPSAATCRPRLRPSLVLWLHGFPGHENPSLGARPLERAARCLAVPSLLHSLSLLSVTAPDHFGVLPRSVPCPQFPSSVPSPTAQPWSSQRELTGGCPAQQPHSTPCLVLASPVPGGQLQRGQSPQECRQGPASGLAGLDG